MTTNPLPPRPNAIATLITTDDFLPGVQTLLYSLKKTLSPPPSQTFYHPPEFIVLATPQVSTEARKTLEKICGRVVVVDPIARGAAPASGGRNPEKSSNGPSHVRSWTEVGYTKLRLWQLAQYEKIVYVDADCVVVKDVGHVLYDEKYAGSQEWIGFSASPDIFPPDKFNGGFLVLKPSLATFAEMMDKAESLPSYDSGDTGFLNAFFSGWYKSFHTSSRLPFGYNAQRTMYHFTHKEQPGYWESIQSDLRVIHYSSNPKPWEKSKEAAAASGELELLWWKTYEGYKEEASTATTTRATNDEVLKQGAISSVCSKSSVDVRPHPSATKTHQQVHQKYNEYRKQGLDSKTAMARARQDAGHVDDAASDNPGQGVASLFGM